jgi:ribosome-binding protein aMBF1 (putative translation factor)
MSSGLHLWHETAGHGVVDTRPLELSGDTVSAMLNLDDFPSRYGRYLRIAMDERKVTADDLAARLGTSERTVRRWLAGECLPRLEVALAIFDTLGRPPVLNLASLVPA